MSRKFLLERSVTEAFLKSMGFNQFELIKPENDPPDIIAKINGKLIGIEVTSIVSNRSQLILEKEFAMIFTRVTELLVQSGIDNLILRIEPEKNIQINRNKCVDAILNICSVKLNQIGLQRTEIAVNPVPGIKRITAFRIPEKGVIITFDSRSHSYGSLHNERFKPIIESKVKKLINSRQSVPQSHSNIDEYWLLMTIEGSFYANFTKVSSNYDSIMVEKCYEKIYVFHERKNWFEEIKTFHNEQHPKSL